MDTAFWQGIVAQDYARPTEPELEVLTDQLVSFLDATDPVQRDEWGYGILVRWVFAGHYDPAALRDLTVRLLPGLQAGIGQHGTDSVFGRSFRALVLGAIMEYDLEHAFLDASEVHASLEAALTYLEREQDVRGFVPGKGWAHALAHTADWLGSLARHPRVGMDDQARLLEVLGAKLSAPTDHALTHHEPSRLAVPAFELIRRQELDPSVLHAWIEGIMTLLDARLQRQFTAGMDASRANVEAFFASLYLLLGKLELPIARRVRSHLEGTFERLGFVIV
jgi:hypothetical protein